MSQCPSLVESFVEGSASELGLDPGAHFIFIQSGSFALRDYFNFPSCNSLNILV